MSNSTSCLDCLGNLIGLAFVGTIFSMLFSKLRLFLSFPTKADNSKLETRCPANTLRKNNLNYFLSQSCRLRV